MGVNGQNIVYKSKLKAFERLEELGYEIKKGKFYYDCAPPPKGKGKVKLENGKITERSLLEYAQTYLTIASNTDEITEKSSGVSSKLADAKLESQRLDNKAKAQRVAREQGRVVPRAEHERAVAQYLVLIKNDVLEACDKIASSLAGLAADDVANRLRGNMETRFNYLTKAGAEFLLRDDDVQIAFEKMDKAHDEAGDN